MDLRQIKEELNIKALNLNTAKDADGQNTEWMRHWDNENRVAVSIHKDLVETLSKNPTTQGLGLQRQMKEGEQGPYTAVRIVLYKAPEMVL